MHADRDRWSDAAPFGLAVAAALLAGVAGCLRLPLLPSTALATGALIAGLVLWARGGWPRCIGAILFGFALAAQRARADPIPVPRG